MSSRTRSRGVICGVICLAVAAACAPPDSGHDPAAELDAALLALVERADGPIGAVVTVHDGVQQRVYNAGRAESGSTAEPNATHRMRIASLTKAMTAAAALTLVGDETLSLSDTVGDWRPDLPAPWHPITVRQLLGHTSGVPDFGANPAFGAAVAASPTAAPPPLDILALAGSGTAFDPAERYQYSNSNPFVTALIVEAATGKPYHRVLSERVLDPLDMTDTYLPAPDDPTVADPVLYGYDPSLDGSAEDVTDLVSFGGWAWASGGVVSTPADVATFVRSYVGGDLFGAELRDAQRRFVVPGNSEPRGPGDNGAGLALFRYRTRCGTMYGHSGSILGYTQFMAASGDGTRSVTVSITTQVSSSSGNDSLLEELRAVEELAVCAALGR